MCAKSALCPKADMCGATWDAMAYSAKDRLLLFGMRDFYQRGFVGLVDIFLIAPAEQMGGRH